MTLPGQADFAYGNTRLRARRSTLLRDANRLQRLCLGRRIVRDLDALLQPELGALRACHGIGFTEGLVLYRPSTDRLWRNAKVAAASFINQPEGGIDDPEVGMRISFAVIEDRSGRPKG